jgi:hypothetical protein
MSDSKSYKTANNSSVKNSPPIKKSASRKKSAPHKKAASHKKDVSRKKSASRTIHKFMRSVDPHKRRAYFLNAICSDAGVCIAFGKEIETIHKHFGGFVDFSYITRPIQRIGVPSSNGFVNEISYERNGYIANSILKSSVSSSADNLMFEYLVGQYINKKCKQFPCFVETYGVFKYMNEYVWNYMKDTSVIDHSIIQQSLLLIPSVNEETMKLSCTHSKHLAILIQHIKEAETLKNMCQNLQFLERDLLYVLYQIYMPLATLADTFTHYDLHASNVLIHEPVKGKCIQYQYFLNDGTVVDFKSRYIVKLIDYGRCHFIDHSERGIKRSSKNIYDAICQLKECEPECGKYTGFKRLAPEEPGSFSSSTRNMSHDLRLLNYISDYISVEFDDLYELPFLNDDLYVELKKVAYGVGLDSDKHYGTIEQTTTGTSQILNVMDVYNAFKRVIMENKLTYDSYYEDVELLGTFHIYENGRPMEFIQN